MADKTKAIAKILIREGYIIGHSVGYVNSETDNGKETIAGVSMRSWPTWKGWKIIDEAKKKPDFPGSLISNTKLFDLLFDFYTVNFWNPIAGDRISDQKIAESLLDGAVLEGISPAIKREEAIFHLPLTGKMSDELINRLNFLL